MHRAVIAPNTSGAVSTGYRAIRTPRLTVVLVQISGIFIIWYPARYKI